MARFSNRSGTALLIIDAQTGVLVRTHDRDKVVANMARLVERARAASTPVIWVQHADAEIVHGSEAWTIAPELAPRADETIIGKHYGDAFEETMLEEVLARLSVARLVVAGAQTDQCIRSTLHGAIARGYDAILVSDAHTTEDLGKWGAPPPDKVIAHTNLYWTYHTAPGREAGIVKTDDVNFGKAP